MVNNISNRRTTPQYARNNDTNDHNSNNVNCAELMKAIMEAHFFALDLKLYLNTHPDDTRAIEMFREACKQYKACKAAFEDSFYPLTACSAGKDGCWDWPDGVWPPKSV